MDAKDLRGESALAERSSDDGAKFSHAANALQYDRAKSCQELGSNSFKADAQGARPCAVIGPDRVAPHARDAFPKKAPVEPWLSPESHYRRPPDYPHKMSEYQDPTRNISPRQTFQENMQRIIMPPGYNAVKLNEDTAYASKNNKLNVPLEGKYCDVPYNVNPMSSDQKNIRNADHSTSNLNPLLVRSASHCWPGGSVSVRPLRPYGASELYQYPDYATCTGPRPPLTRSHTSSHEEPSQLYPDPYYHEGNIRYKPYPNIKERYPPTRYEYLGNNSNPYHPSHPFAAYKYELPKSIPAHPYPGYPPVPIKYDRISEPILDGYQRSFNQQGNYSAPFRNPVIHPPYRPIPGNPLQNKLPPYPSEGLSKPTVSNKLPYDPNNKMYVDYENSRSKVYPVSDNFYLNEMPRPYHTKNPIILSNYPPANIHGVNSHPYIQLKNYEYTRFKNMDPSIMNSPLTKLPMQFSPSALAISPADSNASNDTAQTHGTSQEDCGYVSQSSITSVRSVESLNRIPLDLYGRHDYRYGPIVRASPLSKPEPNYNQVSKSKKDIRQFISSWNEGDEENVESNSKRDAVKTVSGETHSFAKQYEHSNSQEQLYVLGLVNVPSEELGKYEHIQKVSKLPENIKGYNSLELLNQFEEAIESSNISNIKPPTQREVQIPFKSVPHRHDSLPRAVSPLDVEAKISQSVIHKDVGCNFEIKPCSPKMLNVQVAAPVQSILNERVIEKVANPQSIKTSILLHHANEDMDSILNNKSIKYPLINTSSSCKMVNSKLKTEASAIDSLKTNYSLQDLESNSGVCLASLPRLDNDIELNFPEVNQQFINANKTESVITTYPKDLPALDIDRSEVNILKNNFACSEFDMNCQFSPKGKIDTEKEFSRLSKYRKLKRNIPDDYDTTQAKAQATRVDSVIIKNPDNTRILEENTDTTHSGGYLRKDAQEFAINLAPQAKNSQVQDEFDKKCVIPSMYENTENHSPSNFIMHPKIDNLLNKTCNVVDASNHSEVDMQTEDLTMSYRDLPHRYLDKAALDMPMNLSPQAKYSMLGADEEMKNNRSGDKIKHKDSIVDTKSSEFGPDISKDKYTQKDLELAEVKHYKPFKKLKPKKPNTTPVSDIFVTPKMEEPSIPVNCSKMDLGEDCDDAVIDNLNHTEKIDLNCLSTKKSDDPTFVPIPCEGEIKSCDILTPQKTRIDKPRLDSIEENPITNCLDDSKIVLRGNVCIEPSKQINLGQKQGLSNRKNDALAQTDEKECDNVLYAPKLKRSKNRTDITRRKRVAESSLTTVVDRIIKVNNKKSELKLSLNNQTEDLLSEPILDVPPIVINENHIKQIGQIDAEETKFTSGPLNDESTTTVDSDVLLSDKVQNDDSFESNECNDKVVSGVIDENVSLAFFHNEDIVDKTPAEDDKIVNVPETTGCNLLVSINCKKSENNSNTELSLDSPSTSNNETTHDVSGRVTPDALKSNTKGKCNINVNDMPDNFIEELREIKLPNINEETPLEIAGRFYETKPVNEEGILDLCSESNGEKGKDQESNKLSSNKTCLISKSYVGKELFSPRFQNLLIYNEEVSTLLKNKTFLIQATMQNLDCNRIDEPKANDFNEEYVKPKNIVSIDENKSNNSVMHFLSFNSPNDRLYENESKSSIFFEQIEKTNDENLDKITEESHTKLQNIQVTCQSDFPKSFVSNTKVDDNFKENKSSELTTLNIVPKSNGNVKLIGENEDSAKENSAAKPVQRSTEKVVINELDGGLSEISVDHQINLESNTNIQTDVGKTNVSLDDKNTNENQDHSNGYSKINHDDDSCKKRHWSSNFREKSRFSLKRSLSDSALDAYGGDADESIEKGRFLLPKKRKKCYNSSNIEEAHLLNIIQNSRRNSISTIYNENNISFCILINDNCIIAEENYEQENNFAQTEEFHDNNDLISQDHDQCSLPANNIADEETCLAECEEEKSWVEDVGYEEIIETDDIAENIVIGEPKDLDSSDYESDDGDMGILSSAAIDHTNKVKHIYGDNMCTNDAQLVDALYRTPQMDVNKKLMDRESQKTEKTTKYYDSDSLEMLLAEPINNYQYKNSEPDLKFTKIPSSKRTLEDPPYYMENDVRYKEDLSLLVPNHSKFNNITDAENTESSKSLSCTNVNDNTVQSCKTSLENAFSYEQKEDSSYTSSSPEVSSTTSEEKSSSILLKISNYKGSRISEVKNRSNDKRKEDSCKFTEKEYLNPNYNKSSHRPLITKAAQKYIPPLKETIPDLKVKLSLPQQSLMKFKENKVSKEEPKDSTCNKYCKNNNVHQKKELPKKLKPKFEDVLKSIDEVQFQKHKEKNKQSKKIIPKVVIKKSVNGSHYASTAAKTSFNPDLTGRKWQPWVFIEKNQFIDKMALRNKTKAVFSHRKKSFVLHEKFCKYKSISTSKFSISQPKMNEFSKGNLKYTIKLKHGY